MKTWGWISIVFGTLNIVTTILSAFDPEIVEQYGETMAQRFVFGIGLLGLGLYLLHRAEQKKKEKEDKDRWTRN